MPCINIADKPSEFARKSSIRLFLLLAKVNQLRGGVGNDGQGVLIVVVGNRSSIDNFIQQLEQKNHLKQITQIEKTT